MNYRAPKTVTGTIGDKYTFIQWWSSRQLVHAQIIEDGGPELTTDFVVRDSEHGIQLWLGVCLHISPRPYICGFVGVVWTKVDGENHKCR